MRTLITTFLLCLSSLTFAQKAGKVIPSVIFYGVDFSQVNIIGDKKSTPEKFIVAFAKINPLIIAESNKYNIAKKAKVNILENSTKLAINRIGLLRDKNFMDGATQDVNAEEYLKIYGNNDKMGLVIVAKELNKSTNYGKFVYILFDGATQKVIYAKEIKGKAAGGGLRNFWAGSLYNSMKRFK